MYQLRRVLNHGKDRRCHTEEGSPQLNVLGRAVLGPGMVVVAVMRYSVVIALSVLLTMSMVFMRDVRKDEQMPKRYSSAKNRKPPFRRLYLSRAEPRAIGYLHILQSCRVVPDIQHKSISRIIPNQNSNKKEATHIKVNENHCTNTCKIPAIISIHDPKLNTRQHPATLHCIVILITRLRRLSVSFIS